jgi:hypothetical protein
MSLNILLVSDTMIKDRTAIHGNIDPKLIYPDIKLAQDMYIHPLLGTALFNKLLADIDAGSLAGNYKTLVDNYIVDALMYYVLSELPTTIAYQFWNKGVLRKQGADTELPSFDELVSLQNKYKNRAEFYANRMRLYLRQNAPTMFTEYINPGSGVDDINPDCRGFTNPVFLGGDGCCDGRTFEEKYQGDKPNCC